MLRRLKMRLLLCLLAKPGKHCEGVVQSTAAFQEPDLGTFPRVFGLPKKHQKAARGAGDLFKKPKPRLQGAVPAGLAAQLPTCSVQRNTTPRAWWSCMASHRKLAWQQLLSHSSPTTEVQPLEPLCAPCSPHLGDGWIAKDLAHLRHGLVLLTRRWRF